MAKKLTKQEELEALLENTLCPLCENRGKEFQVNMRNNKFGKHKWIECTGCASVFNTGVWERYQYIIEERIAK